MKNKILIGLILLTSSCLTDDSITPAEQLSKDVKKIDDYLASNPGGPTDILVKDASGIRLVITELGTGTIPPNSGNNLKVAYTGRLFSNGAVFDSNDAFFLKLSDGVIAGWKIGLALLTEGSRAKLYIPSVWAYGTGGQGSIPGNAILVFDIFLESVTPTATQETKLALDVEAIDLYLANEQIANVIQDPSGIRYVVNLEGTGATPNSIYNQVKINYEGKLLADGTTFISQIIEPSSFFSSRLVNYPQGLLIGLQLLKIGDKVTFYVPSGLAFGPFGATSNGIQVVPPNANIIFEIELLEVIQ